MKEFIALRAKARERRDRAIAAIRTEYAEQLVQIATLEQGLLGKLAKRPKKVSACVEFVLPKEAAFTAADVLASLEALDATRYWRKRQVDWTLSRLRERGLIRRIKRATIHEPAFYVRADSPIKAGALAEVTLKDMIGRVFAKPMTSVEIAVAVLEAGWQSRMRRANVRQHVARLMRESGYKQQGGKWVP